MNLTVEAITAIYAEAIEAATNVAQELLNKHGDRGACGFAWIEIYSYEGVQIKGNTKVGRLLKSAGIEQNWNRAFYIWSPAKVGCQSVDILSRGACAAAEVFKKYGFAAGSCSRLD